MTTLDLLFGAIGLVVTASAVLAVTTRHLVHAALWLVVTLGSLTGCYLVLGSELVALVQLLVYVGAVVVLVLFALMLTRAPIGPSREHSSGPVQRVAAVVVSAGTALLLGTVLLGGFGSTVFAPPATRTRTVAAQLFGAWVWPFELLSLLLLIALVAAFAVSRMPSDPSAGNAPDPAAPAVEQPDPVTAPPDPSTSHPVAARPEPVAERA